MINSIYFVINRIPKSWVQFTTERRLVQDVSFLLGKSRHDYTQGHPQEVVNLKKAVQEENDGNNNAEHSAQGHDELVGVSQTRYDVFSLKSLTFFSENL